MSLQPLGPNDSVNVERGEARILYELQEAKAGTCFTIGSADDCDIKLSAATVSSQHATLTVNEDGSFTLKDGVGNEDSEHGTAVEIMHKGMIVDWERLEPGQEKRVFSGQEIHFGTCRALLPAQQITLALGESCLIGRLGSLHMPLDAPYVSRHHVHVKRVDTDSYLVEDLSSANHTYVSQYNSGWKRVDRAMFLTSGSYLRLGPTYTIELSGSAAEKLDTRPLAKELTDKTIGSDIAKNINLISEGSLHSFGERYVARRDASQILDELTAQNDFRTLTFPIEEKTFFAEKSQVTLYGKLSRAETRVLKNALKQLAKEFPAFRDELSTVVIAEHRVLGEHLNAHYTPLGMPVKGLFHERTAMLSRELLSQERELLTCLRHAVIRSWFVKDKQEFVLAQEKHTKNDYGYWNPGSCTRALVGSGTSNFNGAIFNSEKTVKPVCIDAADLEELYRDFLEIDLPNRVRYRQHLETDILIAVFEKAKALDESLGDAIHMYALREKARDLGLQNNGVGYELSHAEKIKLLSLSNYIKAGIGDTAIKCLYIGYLVERLREDGLLTGTISYEEGFKPGTKAKSLPYGVLQHGDCTYLRYVSETEGTFIISPKDNLFTPIARALKDGWPYLRESDLEGFLGVPLESFSSVNG